MATLLISAAVNIGVGLLLNAIFPPPDVEQEGPRLTELGFTSAAYGKMVNIVFGTDRVSGNIIDSTDPPIEEVVTKESESAGGKGGGQQVNTTTYTYFLTCRIAWCIEGAVDIIRWWGDGKIILDATGTSQIIKEGVTHTFYPGGSDQLKDPEEVTRRGSNTPAYGHLTSSKVDRMPLADFGNRIPNFTAEIAFASITTNPSISLVEPTGFVVPSADTDYLALNPERNEFYSLDGSGGSANGYWAANASSVTFLTQEYSATGDGLSNPAVGFNGIIYRQDGNTNAAPILGIEVDTGTVLFTKGNSGIGLTDDGVNNWGNSGSWSALQLNLAGLGVRNVLCHLNAFGTANGSIVDADLLPTHNGGSINANIDVLGTGDGFPNQVFNGVAIPDHDRNRFFIFSENGSTSAGTLQLMQVDFTYALDGDGMLAGAVTYTVKREFTKGDAGDDFPTNGVPEGWAVDRASGDLILSTFSDVVLYNPDTDTILAKRSAIGFESRNNYYSGNQLAFFSGSSVHLIDTRDLTTVKSFSLGTINGSATVWDDRTGAIFITIPGNPADTRIQKVFLNRIGADGVGLDTVVAALSTSYQRQKMAGLVAADIDVTTLAGDTVSGYTLNRQSTMKSALQPLRDRFLFDAHQSDWIIKFPKRGATPTIIIPEEDVGILKRGRSMTDEPAVREVRQDDLSLPMSLAVRYRNKNVDYQVDVERDKRHLFPNPTMRSKTERTLDIPIVETATNMKQLAQKTLLTLWNERVTYKTIVPWTYIKLDATDVFSMGVFNETHQLRMAENDLGQGWAIELTGVIEDTKSFSSTLAGGLHSGHVGTTVPSSLPTRLFPLDAPLLSLQDLLLTPISNAYMAVGAFEASWPGATVMKSLDDVQYTATGTANEETAMAKVQTAPEVWNTVNGDFPNRWQEVADGGTMVVTPLRRADEWASTTELLLLAGANTAANIRASDGQVEIFQFQNATLNDNNTVTLTRLLRGRLGTEDVADLGISVSDTCILLSDAANIKDSGPIIRQNLTLSELDKAIFFKGVTIGTLIEDAPVTSATYTGRDIKPYSPVQVDAVADGAGGLDVSWERRARGPFAAEWLDGTGEVVLNETIEQYEITLNTPGAGDFVTKTINDVKTVNFTRAELIGGGADVSFAEAPVPASPDGEFNSDPLLGNWSQPGGGTGLTWLSATSCGSAGEMASGPPAGTTGANFLCATQGPAATFLTELAVTLDIVDDLGVPEELLPFATIFLNCYVAQERTTDEMAIRLLILDADGVSVSEQNTGVFKADPATLGITSIGDWGRVGSNVAGDFTFPVRIALFPGARFFQPRIQTRKFSVATGTARWGFDRMAVETAVVAPDLSTKVSQVSETGLKSPQNVKLFT